MKKSALPLVCVMLFSCAALAQDKTPPSQLTTHFETIAIPPDLMRPLGNGACNRDTSTGAINITGFLTELTMDKSVGAWRFARRPRRQRQREQLWTCRIWAARRTPSPA